MSINTTNGAEHWYHTVVREVVGRRFIVGTSWSLLLCTSSGIQITSYINLRATTPTRLLTAFTSFFFLVSSQLELTFAVAPAHRTNIMIGKPSDNVVRMPAVLAAHTPTEPFRKR